jgi:hypothetical protein
VDSTIQRTRSSLLLLLLLLPPEATDSVIDVEDNFVSEETTKK